MGNLLKNKKLLLIIGGGILAVIAIIIAVVLILNNTGAKGAYGEFWAVKYEGKVEKLEKLAPEEYWEYMDETAKLSLSDAEEKAEENVEDRMDGYKDDYGKNYKASYSIIRETKRSEDVVEDIAKALKKQYKIDADTVTECVELDICREIKGSEDEWTSYYEQDFVKIDGKWYPIYFDEYDGNMTVYFEVTNLI